MHCELNWINFEQETKLKKKLVHFLSIQLLEELDRPRGIIFIGRIFLTYLWCWVNMIVIGNEKMECIYWVNIRIILIKVSWIWQKNQTLVGMNLNWCDVECISFSSWITSTWDSMISLLKLYCSCMILIWDQKYTPIMNFD